VAATHRNRGFVLAARSRVAILWTFISAIAACRKFMPAETKNLKFQAILGVLLHFGDL
jgi:hypothetical protein